MNSTIRLSSSARGNENSLNWRVNNLPEPQWIATHVRMAMRALRGAHGFAQAREELHRSFGLCSPMLNWLSATGADWPAHRQTELLRAFCTLTLRELHDPVADESPDYEPEKELLEVCPCAPLYMRFSANRELYPLAPEFLTHWQADGGPWLLIQPRAWEQQAIALGILDGEQIEQGDVPSMPDSPRLTRSQRAVFGELEGFLRLQQTARTVAGISPRKHPLITGPSGVGKTFLVRLLAAKNRLAFMDFNVSNWLVNGAYQKPHTEQVLADFVHRNDRGIVFIDEVDKIHGTQDWTKHVQQEVFAVLDGRMNTFPSWNETLRRKFVSQFLIVGAGTWQDMQPARAKEIGFGALRPGCGDSSGEPAQVDNAWDKEGFLAGSISASSESAGSASLSLMDLSAQSSIPEELLFRFNSRVVRIDAMARDEMREQIELIYKDLELVLPAHRELASMLDEAMDGGRQHRWLEALVSRLLIENSESTSGLFSAAGSGSSGMRL